MKAINSLTDEDMEIIKAKYAKKFADLCADFLTESGEENLSIEIYTSDRTLTQDIHGNCCYGKTLNVEIETVGKEEVEEDDD